MLGTIIMDYKPSDDALVKVPAIDEIPEALRPFDQWVCWEDSIGEDGRKFCDPVLGPGKLEEHHQLAIAGGYGIGFQLTRDDDFACIRIPDYYNTRSDNRHLLPFTNMQLPESYTQVDHDLRGIHVILSGAHEDNVKGHGIEIWTHDYVIPITGNLHGEFDRVMARGMELRAIVNKYCDLTWPQRLVQLNGTGNDPAVLGALFNQCLSNPDWEDDIETMETLPFLAHCWQVDPLLEFKTMSKLRNGYADKAEKAAFRKSVEAYYPKKEKVAKDKKGGGPSAILHGTYQLSQKGDIKESQTNWEIMLDEEFEWKGKLRLNAFTQRIEVDGKPINELIRAKISSFASRNLELSGSNKTNRDNAILVVGSRDSYDPLQDYIYGLPAWDGILRLKEMFKTYFGVELNAYTEWLGYMMLTCMIARALKPACICRYVVILKGPQNIGKSESVRALGGEYTTELSGNLGTRDAQIQMQGIWVVELGELNSIRKSHRDEAKRFISARYDEFTLKHLNDAVQYPRRCVFIGTGNADEVLND